MDPSLDYRFDGWTLRRQTGELLRDGQRIRLQRHPALILEELLAHPGDLVTREHLIARLWPKGVVEFDTALNTAVHRLRTALGDHADTPRYIETIPRRGYRFVGRLDAPDTLVIASAVAPAAPDVVPSVRGRRLRQAMAAVLLASVAGAALLASGLTGRGDERGLERPGVLAEASAPSRVSEVLELAEYFFQRRGPGDLDLARQYYEEALTIDPGFARAWAGLAGVHWIETVEGAVPPQEGLARLRDAAERALALDPGLAEAHFRLANYRWASGEADKARQHLRDAIALAPGTPLMLGIAAGLAAEDGRFDEAVELQRRAVAGSPLSQVNRFNLAWFLYMAGRIDEAWRELQQAEQLYPVTGKPDELPGILLVLLGRPAEALDLIAHWPDEAARRQVAVLAYHAQGRKAEADAALDALVDLCAKDDPLRLAEVHAFRGEPDQAFEWLRAGSEPDPRMPWNSGRSRDLWMMPRSPLLQSLQADPRWAAWLEAAGLPSTQQVAALHPQHPPGPS